MQASQRGRLAFSSSATTRCNSPPAHLLARRGLVQNIRGYSVYGDYREPDPARRIVDAVANREIDVAAVWGPIAGFFASQERPAAGGHADRAAQRYAYSAELRYRHGVRKQDAELAAAVNQAIDEVGPQIRKILAEYHVPTSPE